jgi:hypothetical protein
MREDKMSFMRVVGRTDYGIQKFMASRRRTDEAYKSMVDTTADRFYFLAFSIVLWFRLKSEQ